MASPAAPLPGSVVPPPPDPQVIRACLSAGLAAEFDREWEFTLNQAKDSKSLAGIHDLIAKWRHTAYMEMRDPGSYYRLLAKAEQISRTGHNPDAASYDDLMTTIQQRLQKR